MLSVVDEELVEQARRFALCFTCETCAHFEPEAQRCGNGYPTEPHRAIALERVNELSFCKEYELA